MIIIEVSGEEVIISPLRAAQSRRKSLRLGAVTALVPVTVTDVRNGLSGQGRALSDILPLSPLLFFLL